jgi:3-oxoacyl-[acyl-carrier-protein] synthase I
MRMALKGMDGKGTPRVDYINPHGTGTPVGDEREIGAIREVFGADRAPFISSTKSLSGHSLGAIGVQEAIFSLAMMQSGFIAESAHIDELDPAFSDMPIVRARRDQEVNVVMSNSFGFGGTNATLVMGRI